MSDPSQGAGPSEGAARPAQLVYWWAPRGSERVFDLAGWPDEALTMAKALLEEDGMAHSWEGDSLVVDAAERDEAAALLDDVVLACEPRLDADADRTAYDLAGWPDFELELLRGALEDAELLFEWTDEDELLVYESDEQRVDELFERLDLRGPNAGVELDGEALSALLTTLFVASDRLTGNVDDTDAVLAAHRCILEVEELAIPYGMDPDGWEELVADARELRRLIEADADADADDAGAPALNDDAATDDAAADDGSDGDMGGSENAMTAKDDDGDLEEDEELLEGDEAIVAMAGRLRDRLKRIL